MSRSFKVKVKLEPERNPYVVDMRGRPGKGAHRNKRKENNKLACRGKHQDD